MVLGRPGQGGQFLGELRLPYERPLASPDLYQLEAFQLLDGLADRGPADAVFPDQLLLRWELGAGGERPVAIEDARSCSIWKYSGMALCGFALIRTS